MVGFFVFFFTLFLGNHLNLAQPGYSLLEKSHCLFTLVEKAESPHFLILFAAVLTSKPPRDRIIFKNNSDIGFFFFFANIFTDDNFNIPMR